MYDIYTPDLLKTDNDAALFEAVHRNIPMDSRKPPLVVAMELAMTRKLGAERGRGVLIVTTARTLTTNGGNGWTGLDAYDLDILDTAITDAVNEVGATGMIDRFIVRMAGRTDIASNGEIDALFD